MFLKFLLLVGGLTQLPLVMAQQPVVPALAIAGNWITDAQASSEIEANPSGNYWWVGKMWGRIDVTGRLDFKAANGCEILGLVAPQAAGFAGTAQVSFCQNQSMNRRYHVTVSNGANKMLTIVLRDISNAGAFGKRETRYIGGTFSSFQR
jgi:hypothetical protein